MSTSTDAIPLGSRAAQSAVETIMSESGDEIRAGRWGAYQARGDEDGLIAILASEIETEAFAEGYAGDRDEFQEESRLYDPFTVWTLVVNQEARAAVGAVRTLVGPVENFQSVAWLGTYWGLDWPAAAEHAGLDPDGDYIEACSFSVLPEWRRADRGWPAKVEIAAHYHIGEDVDALASLQIINPRVKRSFQRWGLKFSELAPGTARIIGSQWAATAIPSVPAEERVTSSDFEFNALAAKRSTTGRGGTRLPKGGADSVAATLHRELVTAATR